MTARRLPTVPLWFLGCWLLASALLAQTRKPSPKDLPASAFKVTAVKVTGTKRYRTEDIVRATGLRVGQVAHEDDCKDGIRVLGDSGAFTDVAYTFEYSAEGTKVEWKLQDSDRFVPVRFENLIWFTDRELYDQVHAQVPLFTGELPVTGQLVNQLSDALQGLLIEKKVEGRVDYVRVGAEDGPTQAFAFSITGPHITIRKVEFSGSDASLLPVLETASKELEDAEYVRSNLRKQEDTLFLPAYQQHGYLKAEFGDPQPRIVQSDAQEIAVDVTIPVVPGHQYKLQALELAGAKAIPAETLRKAIALQVNQPVNTSELGKGIEAIKQLYGARGYMTADMKTDTQIDDPRSSVKYRLNITEGEVYTMGELDVHAPDSRTRAQLESKWNLRPGDTYDSSYPARYITQVLKEILTTGEWDTSVHESLNPSDKTVDVTVRFAPK